MKIKLSKTYDVHGRAVSEIEVREPWGALLLVHGEPFQMVQGRGGASIQVDNLEAIAAYLHAVTEPGPELLVQLNVRDFIAARTALLGFFGEPEEGLTGSLTPSSSDSTAA